MEKKLKGITINGVSLSQFLRKKEWEEIKTQESPSGYLEEEQSEIREKRRYMRNIGRKSKHHYYKKLAPDRGRKLNMSEINKEYLKTNIEGQDTLAGKVLCVLLTGGEWKSKDIYKEINRVVPNSHKGRMIRKQDVYSGISQITNSNFAPLLIKKASGSGVVYSLHKDCYEYSPSDLRKVMNKRDKSMSIHDIANVDLKEERKKEQKESEEESEEEPEEEPAPVPDLKTDAKPPILNTDHIIRTLKSSVIEDLQNTLIKPNKLEIEVKIMLGWMKEK